MTAAGFDALFGSRLRDRRHRLGLTLRAVAAGTGLSVGFLSDLETGKRGCGLWTAAALCTALGCNVGDLIPHWDDEGERWQ